MAQSPRFWVIACAAVFGGVTGGVMAWLGDWSMWGAAAGGAFWAALTILLMMVSGVAREAGIPFREAAHGYDE